LVATGIYGFDVPSINAVMLTRPHAVQGQGLGWQSPVSPDVISGHMSHYKVIDCLLQKIYRQTLKKITYLATMPRFLAQGQGLGLQGQGRGILGQGQA